MIFRDIIQSFVLGVILLLFFLSPIMANKGLNSYSDPIPRKYHKYYYFFLFIVYTSTLLYFLLENEIEFIIGNICLGLLVLIIIIKNLYSRKKTKHLVDEILKMMDEDVNKMKTSIEKIEIQENDESQDEFDFTIKLIAGSIIVWLILWIGTYINWQDYAYYSFLKIIAIFISLCMIEISYELSKTFFLMFLIIAIIFNPIFPFKFDREIWQIFDISTLMILIFFYFKVKKSINLKVLKKKSTD